MRKVNYTGTNNKAEAKQQWHSNEGTTITECNNGNNRKLNNYIKNN